MNFAQALKALGQDQNADNATSGAQGLLEEDSLKLLSTNPANPCGQFSVAIQQLSSLVASALSNSNLATQLLSKACTFNVSPDYLFLNVGETWQQGITAALKDPQGNPSSCSVINWYSANLNVVDIAANGNFCVPTGVGPGIANVSANCDGLLGATQVSVCSLSGTWQGTYSGQTISCAQRNQDGCCIQWGGPKQQSGLISVTFSQNGTSVSTVIAGYPATGTDINGTVNLETTIPAACGTRPGIPEPSEGIPVQEISGHRIPSGQQVVGHSVLGGLHHEYRLEKVAA